ncbi:kinesin-like protein Klp59C [Scaptodrosophila lebanonensis]|uniref:Kinesin-like protein n=1 Tax=Drosophila lebanonensis TaxID=7225 RepID=A0A6J2U8B0_DROLE|nr:kinesin-like protein Klp59C [Scaptodrosophila lebanonensis]
MDVLSINQEVFIQRSDGRIHKACIIKLDGGVNNVITVEWSEGSTVRGKELPLSAVVQMNPELFQQSNSAHPSHSSKAFHPQPVTTSSPASNTINGRSDDPGIRDQPNSYVKTAATELPFPEADIPLTIHRLAGPTNSNINTRARSPQCIAEPRKRPMPSEPEIQNSGRPDIVQVIDQMRERREKRRELQALARQQREQIKNADPDNPNWEIARMIRMHQRQMVFDPLLGPGQPLKQHQIMVCVRKRPLNRKEVAEKEQDVISVPTKDVLVVHEPKKQVDLTKFLENHKFRFDYTFNELCSNATVYEYTARPLVKHIFDGGMATCFAYGQTGSGKTHTMGGEFTGKQQNCRDGIYAMTASDVFAHLLIPRYAQLGLRVTCSFFEIYGMRVSDLLVPGKPQLRVLEDGHQQVQVVGLTEKPVENAEDVLQLIEMGHSVRTSGQTSANATSSRSHAIFQIVLRVGNKGKLHGKFSLIDLAGNERGADNCSACRRTRLEGAEINKSLLALKECIRALSRQSRHLPFRGSKLTQVLRDSFIGGRKVKTCMIAMISPGLHSCENTLNTLRYADRVKELTSQPEGKVKAATSGGRTYEMDKGTTAAQSTRISQPAAASRPNHTAPLTNNFNGSCNVWNVTNVTQALDKNNMVFLNAMTESFVEAQKQLLNSFHASEHNLSNNQSTAATSPGAPSELPIAFSFEETLACSTPFLEDNLSKIRETCHQ